MVHGSCLCGAIRFEADGVPLITNCHCSKCRKAVGAAFRSTACVPLAQFRFVQGENQIQTYQPPVPGYTNTFCGTCGSNAPWVDEKRQLALIPAGLLEDDPGVRPALHMFVGSKAPWWKITDAAPQFEEWVPGFGPDAPRD